MTGKEKCEVLKQIRRDVVSANGLDVAVTDCNHTGDCSGTCPKCEAEVRKIENELNRKRALGMRVAAAGLSAAMITASFAGCHVIRGPEVLEGDVPYVSETDDLGGAVAGDDGTNEYVLEGEVAETEEYSLEGDVVCDPDDETSEEEKTDSPDGSEAEESSAAG